MNIKIPKLVIFSFIAIIILAGGFFAYKYFSANSPSPELTKESVLTKLDKIMLLPDEKDPKIATINNVDTLKNENAEFYKNAENGDTLVLYSELVIIYRDSNNKIVNLASIAKDSESNSSGN